MRWDDVPDNVRGGIFILLAGGLFSIMVALIKLVGARIHVTEILFFRQTTMMLLALPALIHGLPGTLKSARVDLQVVRVIAAFAAMLLGFSAVINLPLADATTISFSKSFFITALAILLLGEVVGIRRWAALAAGFCGVLIVAWPQGSDSFNIYGVMAIMSAAAVGLVMVIIRKLSQVDHPVTILSYQAVGVGLLMVPPTIWFWIAPTLTELLLLIAIGVVSALGQYLNILGLRSGEASAVAPLEYVRLIYVIALGYLIFDEWPEPRVFLGAAIIIGATVYTLHRERRTASKLAGCRDANPL